MGTKIAGIEADVYIPDAKGQRGLLRKQTLLSVVVNALLPAEAGRNSEIQASLVYRSKFRIVRVAQKNKKTET